MPNVRGVVNHLKYIRSNWTVVVGTFMLVVAAILVGSSLIRSSADANAATYVYPTNGSTYSYGTYAPNNYNNGGYSYSNSAYRPTNTSQPVFTCNSLGVGTANQRTFRFTTSATASNGASIVGYRYEYGDGGVQNGPSTVDHTYNRAGTFTARAWVLFRVNGQDRWITSTGCTRTVTVSNHTPCPHYGNNCSPYPTPTYTPQPVYACNNLSVTRVGDRTFRFTTSASASNGASIVGYRYEYGDGGVQNGPATVDHTYNRAGTYTARAWVLFRVNGQDRWITSTGCTKTVSVTGTTPTYSPYPTPTYSPHPSYACNNLSVTRVGDRTFRFTTSASASNGVSITGYRYEYGDGGVQDGSATVNHTYNRAATYTARAWVRLSVNGQERWVTSTGCTKAVYVTGTTPTYSPQPSYTPCPASGYNYHCHYPSNSPIPSVTANRNENNNTNNNSSSATATATANVVINQAPAEAKTASVQNASTVSAPAPAVAAASTVTPATVTSLPETGPENLIVGGLGFGSMVIAGSAYLNSRRELLGAFLKK